jgi:hypothetical protein
MGTEDLIQVAYGRRVLRKGAAAPSNAPLSSLLLKLSASPSLLLGHGSTASTEMNLNRERFSLWGLANLRTG